LRSLRTYGSVRRNQFAPTIAGEPRASAAKFRHRRPLKRVTPFPEFCRIVRWRTLFTVNSQEMTMASDTDIRRFVEDELRWDPDIDASDIAISVRGCAVTLDGFAESFNDELEAEAAAKCATGVVVLANDIGVRLRNIALRPKPAVSADGIQVVV